MEIAIWIIVAVEVIRAVQNHVQLMSLRHSRENSDTATQAFVDSLKATDRAFVRSMLEAIDKGEAETVHESESDDTL